MIKCISINIYGKVQNVGFRYYTRKKALSLQLNGYVRNLPDGSVVTEVCGSPEKIKAFVEYCKTGPDWARVDEVKVQEIQAQNHSGFEIR